MPFEGSSGPNAAGRARKKVELSSVRLMMADGGHSDDGVWNENRARSRPDLVFESDVSTVPDLGWADSRERKVTKKGRTMKHVRRRTSRRGRMAISVVHMKEKRLGEGRESESDTKDPYDGFNRSKVYKEGVNRRVARRRSRRRDW